MFSETLAKARDLLVAGQALLLTVDVQVNDEGTRLSAVEVEDLDAAVAEAAAGLRIYLDSPKPLDHLRNILHREGRGRGKVSLVLGLEGGEEVEMELPGNYRLSAGARQALKSLPGVVVQDL